MRAMILALAMVGMPAGAAPLTIPSTLAEMNRRFICPETLPDDAMRMTEMEMFDQGVRRVRPELKPAQQIAFIEHLYHSHHCANPNVSR